MRIRSPVVVPRISRRSSRVARLAARNAAQAQRIHELEHHAERMALLGVVGAMLSGASDYADGITRMISLLVPRLGSSCMIELTGHDLRAERLYGRWQHKQAIVNTWTPFMRPAPAEHPFAAQIARQGATILAQLNPAQAELLHVSTTATALIVPIQLGKRAFGLLALTREQPATYHPADVTLADDLAIHLAQILEQVRLTAASRYATQIKDDAFALLNAIFASTPIGLAAMDTNLRYLRVNHALAAFDGLPLTAYLGRTPSEILPALAPVIEPVIRRVLATGEAVRDLEIQRRVVLEGNPPRSWLANYYPVHNNEGQIMGVGAAVIEITERMRTEQALRDRDLALRQAYDAANLGTWQHDLIGDPLHLHLDEQARLHYGLPTHHVTIEMLVAQSHPDDRAAMLAVREQAHDPTGPGYAVIEHRVIHPDTSIHWLVVHLWTVFTTIAGQRQPTLVTGIVQDVTTQKQALAVAKAASERIARLQAMTAALSGALSRREVVEVITHHALIVSAAHSTVITLLNPHNEQLEIVGWAGTTYQQLEAFQGLSLQAPIPPTTAVRTLQPIWLSSPDVAEAQFPGSLALMAKQGDQAYAALPMMTANQVVGAISFSYAAQNPFGSDEQALLINLANQCAQALERAQLYAEVLASRARLQALSQRLVEAQEEERRHLARELHDEIGQSLTGLNLVLTIGHNLPRDQLYAQLAEAQRQVATLITQVRQRSLDLRPAMLDELGLRAALNWYLERYQAQTGLQVAVVLSLGEQRFPPVVELTAYRLVQEALTNVARHAGSCKVNLVLWIAGNELLIEVSDNGVGFDPTGVLRTHRSSGLAGMRERTVLLGGELTIEAAPGLGTRLLANLPLSRPSEPQESEDER